MTHGSRKRVENEHSDGLRKATAEFVLTFDLFRAADKRGSAIPPLFSRQTRTRM